MRFRPLASVRCSLKHLQQADGQIERELGRKWKRKQTIYHASTRKHSTAPEPLSILKDQHLLEDIPTSNIRNFCLLAHVDHGKSSLSSRFLELAGNQGDLDREEISLMDTLAVEQERGITVKTSTATMLYRHPETQEPLLLNLYDTPGHVDFGREVVRTLQFVQGAVLLLDATQGIQAQTWTVHEAAQHVKLLWALTKVDLESARPLHTALQAAEWFDCDPDAILRTSARERIGIRELLDTVCLEVSPPPMLYADDDRLRAQVVDSWYDDRGVNCLVQILSGRLSETDRIAMVNSASQQSYSVQEVGMLLPAPYRTGVLRPGQMGYCRFGLRDPRRAKPGTVLILNEDVQKQISLPVPMDEGDAQSMMYASVHPQDVSEFEELCDAINRLALNDTGLEVQKTSALGGEGGGPFLGPGLRVGFQGLLHAEVFQQRLYDEFGMEAVVTPSKVPYTVTYLPGKKNNRTEAHTEVVEDLRQWPGPAERVLIEEPMVAARIMARVDDAGAVMDLLARKRGIKMKTTPFDDEKWLFTADLPWAEVRNVVSGE